ncbi:MAG: hypothetical protein ACREXP_18965 [Steroidobacteraceae bacterium]
MTETINLTISSVTLERLVLTGRDAAETCDSDDRAENLERGLHLGCSFVSRS